MNAFIIGNGFDIAHNMPTAYGNYKKHLLNRFPEMDRDYMYIPSLVTALDGGEAVDEEGVASLLCYLPAVY